MAYASEVEYAATNYMVIRFPSTCMCSSTWSPQSQIRELMTTIGKDMHKHKLCRGVSSRGPLWWCQWCMNKSTFQEDPVLLSSKSSDLENFKQEYWILWTLYTRARYRNVGRGPPCTYKHLKEWASSFRPRRDSERHHFHQVLWTDPYRSTQWPGTRGTTKATVRLWLKRVPGVSKKMKD